MSLPSVKPQTVYLVDDDAEFRESLESLIIALGYPVRAYDHPTQFLHDYQSDWPGCLLLDVRMPGQSGLELYEQLIREEKRLPVVFVTAHADVSTAVSAMKSGAIEFLEKPFDHHRLAELIESAMALDLKWRASEDRFREIHDRVSTLSSRDRETLELVLEGATNKAIAARLFLSERAVEFRRARLMKKLEVRSLAELMELAITHRLLAEIRDARRQSPLALD
jgi:FixJ family two-component response regulator